jgi:hypothetical protein
MMACALPQRIRQFAKVFCFFSSEKKTFLLSTPKAAPPADDVATPKRWGTSAWRPNFHPSLIRATPITCIQQQPRAAAFRGASQHSQSYSALHPSRNPSA